MLASLFRDSFGGTQWCYVFFRVFLIVSPFWISLNQVPNKSCSCFFPSHRWPAPCVERYSCCRGYSIASSPMMHPEKIQLCVVLVDWTVESTQELRLGEATGRGREVV